MLNNFTQNICLLKDGCIFHYTINVLLFSPSSETWVCHHIRKVTNSFLIWSRETMKYWLKRKILLEQEKCTSGTNTCLPSTTIAILVQTKWKWTIISSKAPLPFLTPRRRTKWNRTTWQAVIWRTLQPYPVFIVC